ncbi:MAG: ester cyclase [Lachnospiraceae bacterium]
MAEKEMIREFYERFFNQHDVEAADDYVREDYIQHNPGVPQGREGLKNAFRDKFKSNPEFHLRIDKMIQEDDMVVVYLKNLNSDGTTKVRVVDIYRVLEGKLAEHWDVLQLC